MAEKSSWDRQKLGLIWRNRKKISQIINDYLCLPFFLFIILCFDLSTLNLNCIAVAGWPTQYPYDWRGFARVKKRTVSRPLSTVYYYFMVFSPPGALVFSFPVVECDIETTFYGVSRMRELPGHHLPGR